MKVLIAGLQAILFVFAASATAQEAKLPGQVYSVVLTNLRSMTESQDARGVMRPERVTDTGFAFLDVTKDRTLWGSALIGSCPDLRTKGVSRMRYPMQGGFDMDLDSCGSGEYEVDFLWKTDADASGGRLRIEGEIKFQYACQPDPQDCPYQTLKVTERAILRLEGRTCTLTLYERRETYMAEEDGAKPGQKNRVLVSTPLTRCEIR